MFTNPVKGWVVFKGDNPIGIDSSSGYPYDARIVNDIKFWHSRETAQEFCDIINFGISYELYTVRRGVVNFISEE